MLVYWVLLLAIWVNEISLKWYRSYRLVGIGTTQPIYTLSKETNGAMLMMSQGTQVSASKQSKKHMRFWRYGAMLRKPSQATRLLLHLRWNHGGSTDGTDSNKGLTNGDCSNGILSFLALSPVFSFHLYIKVGLWTLTELTEFSTRRLSWMKRERRIIKSWIRWFIRIRFSERIGVWNIDNKYNTIWGWIVPHMER